MDALSVEAVDGTGRSYYLRDTGTWGQMREYFVHRSLYHLKEADPHAFAIPRLIGQAKASFVAVEFDEYGGGRGALVHQQLFADLMDAAGLDSGYLAYLDDVPADVLASVRSAPRAARCRDRAFRVVGDLVAREPHLERAVVFGIKARDVVEDRLATHVMDCWQAGRSSLCRPLT